MSESRTSRVHEDFYNLMGNVKKKLNLPLNEPQCSKVIADQYNAMVSHFDAQFKAAKGKKCIEIKTTLKL